MLAISDGMGSGKIAQKSSKLTIQMLEKMFVAGFNKHISLELINNALRLSEKESFTTVDCSIVNLDTGKLEMIKLGACSTFIKRNNNIKLIKCVSLPIGILENVEVETYTEKLEKDDIIIMCSDGILDADMEAENKELELQILLSKITTVDVQKIANIIIAEAIDKTFGIARDDMVIIVAKLV